MLKIADEISLPDAAVTEVMAYLGRRGSGKTYAATKAAEEMYRVRAQIVALDPVGVWYGLRLASDGKAKGLDLPIFGGLNGDVPITPASGAIVADAVIDYRLSAIVDVSQFEDDSDKNRFVFDFAKRFFFRKKAAPSAVHLFIEEAQEFVPQSLQKGEERMLHAMQRLVRLGRNYGIGISLITQRPQDVNKKALNQAEVVLAFQLTGPQEIDAVKYWCEQKGFGEDLKAILPKLETGHAHVWSPVLLKKNREVHIAEKQTFAAGSTPKIGAKPVRTTNLEPVEIEALQKRMAETIEKAKASDPALLQREIARLRRQLAESQTQKGDPEAAKRVAQLERELAKPVRVPAEVLEAARVEGRKQLAKELATYASRLLKIRDVLGETAVGLRALVETEQGRGAQEGIPAHVTREVPVAPTPAKREAESAPVRRREIDPGSNGRDPSLGRPERALLRVLAQFPEGRTKAQLSILSTYSIKSSSFANALGALRSRGLAEGSALIRITGAGIDIAGEIPPPVTGRDLLNQWLVSLGKAEATMLQVLAEAGTLTKEELSERSGYSITSSSFANALGRLRTLQLISGKQSLAISPELL